MVKVELRLRKSQKLKTGEYGIYFYIRYQGKARWRHSGFKSFEKDWSYEKQNIKASHPLGRRGQEALKTEAIALHQHLAAAEAKNIPYENIAESAGDYVSFTSHFKRRMDQLYLAGDLGNYELHAVTLKDFQNFIRRDDIDFSLINYSTLKSYEAFLDGRNLKLTTIKLKFRILKAVWNDAVRTYEDVGGNPFAGILKNRTSSSDRLKKDRHQPISVIQQLYQYESKIPGEILARDMWLMAFGLRGAGIIDMIYMTTSAINDGYYVYDRLKMPKRQVWIKVKLMPWHYDILERHQYEKRNYLFGLVTVPRNDRALLEGRKKPEGTHQYNRARTRVDKNLKRISQKLNLDKPLSMIQARHSWVLSARDLGISKDIIQQAVGHRGQSVMDLHYFGNYDQGLLDDVNQRVLALIVKS